MTVSVNNIVNSVVSSTMTVRLNIFDWQYRVFGNEMVVHGGCNVKLVVHEGKWRENCSSWGEKLISPKNKYIGQKQGNSIVKGAGHKQGNSIISLYSSMHHLSLLLCFLLSNFLCDLRDKRKKDLENTAYSIWEEIWAATSNPPLNYLTSLAKHSRWNPWSHRQRER